MKRTILSVLTVCVLALGLAGSASATSIYWSMNHSYPSDLVVTLGAGSTSAPDWSAVIQNHEWDYSDTYTLPGAAEDQLWGNTWWIRFQDEWRYDAGTITSFTLTDDYGNTYVSTDTPVYIPDGSTRYAFIDMPANPVPEPGTMLLLGSGLVGLAGYSRKRKVS